LNLGDRIKKRRLELNITQKELAENICTQSQISNIEKNQLIPMSSLLFEISNKLHVSMDYLYGKSDENYNFKKVQELFSNLLYKRDYEAIKIALESDIIDETTPEKVAYKKYLSSIVLSSTVDINKAQELLTEAYELVHTSNNFELLLSIINAQAILFSKTNDINESKQKLRSAIKLIEDKNYQSEITIKIYHTFTLIEMQDKNYKKALQFVNSAIHDSILIRNSTLLSDLLFDKYILQKKLNINDWDNNHLISSAYYLARIEHKSSLVEKIERYIKEV